MSYKWAYRSVQLTLEELESTLPLCAAGLWPITAELTLWCYWVRVIFPLTIEVGEVVLTHRVKVKWISKKKFLSRGGMTTEPFA